MKAIVLSALIALTVAGCGQSSSTGTPPNAEDAKGAVALLRVNDSVITQAMVDSLLRQRGIKEPQPDDLSTAVQDIEKVLLMAQEGERLKLDEASHFVADMQLLRLSRLADFTADKMIVGAPISDEQVKAEYDSQVAKIGNQEFEVKQMVFKEEASALVAIGELLKGADFNATGTTMTKDKPDAQAGDLGWINLAQVPAEFAPVLATLAVGDFTPVPIKSAYGFHVLKLVQTRTLNAPNFEEVKLGVKQALEKKVVDERLKALKASAKIEPVTG